MSNIFSVSDCDHIYDEGPDKVFFSKKKTKKISKKLVALFRTFVVRMGLREKKMKALKSLNILWNFLEIESDLFFFRF